MAGKKEQILDAALALFAEKGFDATSIDEIGMAINMKGPALYHYFKGKDALLDALLDRLNEYYEANFGSAEKIPAYPQNLQEFMAQSLGRLNFTIHDPQVKKVRRLLAMEQFRSEKLAKLASLHQLAAIESMNTVLFEKLIENGSVKPFDPKMLAFEFTAPVSLLIQVIDREPEREAEMMERVRAHMQHFAEVYGK